MTALKSYHPAVAIVYFGSVVVLCFLSAEPVFKCIGLVSAVLTGLAFFGWRTFGRSLLWMLPLAALVCAFNAVFNANGLTVLFTLEWPLGVSPVTLEALLYGASFGLMLVSVLAWCSLATKVLSQHDFLAVLGRVLPTVALLLARITVFVPELVAYARKIERAQRALGEAGAGQEERSLAPSGQLDTKRCSACTTPLRRPQRRRTLRYAVTLIVQIMEWGMERSLVTADSMKARGYGALPRSSYTEQGLARRDSALLVLVLLLALSLGVLQLMAAAEYSFYPLLSPFVWRWAYVPYLAFCLLPFILEAAEALAWELSRPRSAQ